MATAAGADALLVFPSDVLTMGGQQRPECARAHVGASTSKGREKISVWASFDGECTWLVKRLVYDGPSAYSNLGVGRTGTPSQGKIYLIFEGGPSGCYEAVHVVSFNLSWLLDGRDVSGFL
jgi:sialidase-1